MKGLRWRTGTLLGCHARERGDENIISNNSCLVTSNSSKRVYSQYRRTARSRGSCNVKIMLWQLIVLDMSSLFDNGENTISLGLHLTSHESLPWSKQLQTFHGTRR